MARSEFRYNKKRKHYAYLFKDKGDYRKNILLSTKPYRMIKGKIYQNIRLSKHPNKNSNKEVYLMDYVSTDHKNSFRKKLNNWQFDKNDKRKVKRIIKKHK